MISHWYQILDVSDVGHQMSDWSTLLRTNVSVSPECFQLQERGHTVEAELQAVSSVGCFVLRWVTVNQLKNSR